MIRIEKVKSLPLIQNEGNLKNLNGFIPRHFLRITLRYIRILEDTAGRQDFDGTKVSYK